MSDWKQCTNNARKTGLRRLQFPSGRAKGEDRATEHSCKGPGDRRVTEDDSS